MRIDGATDVSKRQDVVNAFNRYGVGQVGGRLAMQAEAGRPGSLTGWLHERLPCLWQPLVHLACIACIAVCLLASFQVFLLSTTAGGAGLNLTGANRLVLLDRCGCPLLLPCWQSVAVCTTPAPLERMARS